MPTKPIAVPRGWLLGRMVDGYEVAIDGQPPRWQDPPWIDRLRVAGYDPIADGPVRYVVTAGGEDRNVGDGDIRDAFRFVLSLVETGRGPGGLSVDCRASSGRTEQVASGDVLLGICHSALEERPIRRLEGPAVLPEHEPRSSAHRSH